MLQFETKREKNECTKRSRGLSQYILPLPQPMKPEAGGSNNKQGIQIHPFSCKTICKDLAYYINSFSHNTFI